MANFPSPIPPHAWSRPIGQAWDKPYIVRYASNLDDGPNHGAPLGGLGAGCLGRAPSGDFNLWHLDGGEHTYARFPACQFSLFEAAGGSSQAYALCTESPTDGSLGAWQWWQPGSPSPQTPLPGGEGIPALPKEKGLGDEGQTPNFQSNTYSALYPRSWFTYGQPLAAQVICEQLTPILPHNYQETSYPVAVFEWTAHNPTDQPITLSLLLTWQNMVGWFTNTQKSPEVQRRDDGSPFYDYVPALGRSPGNFNIWKQAGDLAGCVMDGAWTGEPQEGDGQFAIATPAQPGLEVFHHSRWNPVGDGNEIWQSFSQDGSLGNVEDTTPAGPEEQIGVALAVRFTLTPGETRRLPMVLAWDLPVTEFATGVSDWRRYTDFFDRSGRNAWDIAATALAHYPQWQQQVQQWQQPILDRPDLPSWFKMALFNELYDLASGGTLWTAATTSDPVGRLAVLECLDYRWYESLDVRLYGGFGLLMLWPDLEKALMRAFAQGIPTEDKTPRIVGYYATVGQASPPAIRKAKGATPHDLGAPNEQPFVQTNYTSYQDCNQWKDLGSDFVLQVYRAFHLTGAQDVEFVVDCWPAVVETLHYLKRFDRDGDGIPENGGAPDQTFDDWQLQGVSAYCGGLWLAALDAAIALAAVLKDHNRAPGTLPILLTQFQRWREQGQRVYHKRLWTGSYYRLDSQSQSDVVMADQLCGQFFARLLGLPDVVEPEYIETTLATIYQACFVNFNQYVQNHALSQNQKFAGAQTGCFSAASLGVAVGAANGVQLDGSPEDPDGTHQLEVWTGINFGLAAFMAQMGMTDQALEITEAVVRQIYNHGLQFRTPEAITAVGTFRACHYLRPMAIWGLYGVLTDFWD